MFHKAVKTDGCWLWPGKLTATGYARVKDPAARRNVLAHRYAWTHKHGPVPDGMRVLHRCDVRNCVNPDHLFLGTQADNVADMIAKGRDRKATGERSRPSRGETNPHAKLTEAAVREIRSRRANGEYFTSIAAAFGVSATTIQSVVRRRQWAHVT